MPPLWCGMVIAIAAEAQLKFLAPGITRELGLGIGKIVFTALNRAECVVAIILAIAFFAFAAGKWVRIVFAALALILLAQTFWLMPFLIERIDLIVAGQTPPASSVHIFYVVLEILKILLLLALSIAVNWQNENFRDETRY